mgnify:CR=1 FL=1
MKQILFLGIVFFVIGVVSVTSSCGKKEDPSNPPPPPPPPPNMVFSVKWGNGNSIDGVLNSSAKYTNEEARLEYETAAQILAQMSARGEVSDEPGIE